MTIQTTHYGVTIYCEVNDYPGCCGASVLVRFGARGNVDNLTMGQKHEMYKELMTKIRDRCPGVLVATDAIVNFGPFAELDRATSQWKRSDSAGDISLEDFCEYFKFTKSGVAKNRNSGNLVACYSLAVRPADEEDPSKSTVFHVDKPDFSDEPKPGNANDSDVEQIIREVNAFLEA